MHSVKLPKIRVQAKPFWPRYFAATHKYFYLLISKIIVYINYLISGRVAQWESTSLTSKGSQVQSLSRPPFSFEITAPLLSFIRFSRFEVLCVRLTRSLPQKASEPVI